jgi:hypothetical protein
MQWFLHSLMSKFLLGRLVAALSLANHIL